MKTAVDSSVLLDVLGGDPQHLERSRAALKAAYDAGTLLASEVVWAEVRAHFPTDAEFGRAMDGLGIRCDPCGPEAAAAAGRFWRENRKGAKGPRLRVVADFLVGAHAQHQADGLLTRDRGFYRRYFQELRLIDPSSS